jgi:hypothetical protein
MNPGVRVEYRLPSAATAALLPGQAKPERKVGDNCRLVCHDSHG